MEQYLTLDYLLMWTMMSMVVWFLWAMMMDDPGGSKIQDVIITVICAILGLPITIIIGVWIVGMILYITLKKEQ
tara:strand:- start:259 stop:480 length:222 start_codon:yes stop_codon:yes gene_type:complete